MHIKIRKISLLCATLVLLILLFTGCKKNNGSASYANGKVVLVDVNGDSTVYPISMGGLNVDRLGTYSTTATSGDSSVNITILGQIFIGQNNTNGINVTVTTNNSNAISEYTPGNGVIVLSGDSLTFGTYGIELQSVTSHSTFYILTGYIKY